MAWVSLCDLDELAAGQGKYAEVDGFRIALFLDQGTVYAIDNTCPHAGASMAGGFVDNGCAICPWHGWRFRLSDGHMPDAEGVRIDTYPTRLYPRPGRPTLVQADLPMP